MKNILYFLASFLVFSSCSKTEKKTLTDIQSEVVKYCAGKDSIVYQFSDERIGVFKTFKKDEDTILFVRGIKEDQDLLIEANIDKQGRIYIISENLLSSSKKGDYKERIESLLRAFYTDIFGGEPQ